MLELCRKKIFSKQGNDILQTLIVLFIIGALVITLCTVISNQFKRSGENTMDTMSNGTIGTVRNALSPNEENIDGL